MKILVVADRPPKQSFAKILAEHPDIEIICLLGDLGIMELPGLENIIHIPKLGVYGNHCSGSYFKELGIENMHLKTLTIKGVVFGGFEGSVRYKEDPEAKMYTQEEASIMLQDFPCVDVLLSHCPPFGINDEKGEPTHEGFRALRTYVEKHHPRHLFHGHTYPKQSEIVTSYLGSAIHYVYSDKVIII